MTLANGDRKGTGPIFIGGAARSGKTLMRWILSSHTRIVVSRRTDMWPRFRGRCGDLSRPENLERCLEAMLARKQIAALSFDVERLRRDFRDGPATYSRLFRLIHEQFAERSGKPRWGDQTGLIERYADELAAAYPGMRLIQMVRDPRDRFAALLDRGQRRVGAVVATTTEWLHSVSSADRNTRRHPDSCLVVRYESLVEQPEATIRAVCAFVGEAFEADLLRIPGARRYDPQRAASSDGSPISSEFVGRYREAVSRRDIAFIQAVAGSQMIAFDYPPDPIRPSIRHRLRWTIVERPLGLTRLARNGRNGHGAEPAERTEHRQAAP